MGERKWDINRRNSVVKRGWVWYDGEAVWLIAGALIENGKGDSHDKKRSD